MDKRDEVQSYWDVILWQAEGFKLLKRLADRHMEFGVWEEASAWTERHGPQIERLERRVTEEGFESLREVLDHAPAELPAQIAADLRAVANEGHELITRALRTTFGGQPQA